MASDHQGQRATRWPTHLFFDTGYYPAIKDGIESESEFEDWKVKNTILAIIHSLVSMLFLLICLVLEPDFSGFIDVGLSVFLSFPITMYTSWLDPLHAEILGLILLDTLQFAVWIDFFVRTVIIGKTSRRPQCILGTALLIFTFVNLLRVVHWYLRCFLCLGMHKAGGEANLEIDENALPEPYSEENALLPPHSDEEELPGSYSDGLLGLADREQLEETRQQTNSSKMNKFGGKDTDEGHDSQPQRYHDNDRPSPASAIRAQSPFLTDDYAEPTALQISPPPPRQGDSLQVRQQELHSKPLSFHPRFKWQQSNLPSRFHKSLASLSLCLGICYLSAETASLSMGAHYCRMNIPL